MQSTHHDIVQFSQKSVDVFLLLVLSYESLLTVHIYSQFHSAANMYVFVD
jgi:hypothetical protein